MTLGAGSGPAEWEILERRQAYRGFFGLDVVKLRHRRFDGTWSNPLVREQFLMRRAVAVLPYHAASDTVVLVEQFRAGIIDALPRPWIIEAPAGLVEAGEALEDVARRECREETGLMLGRLRHACDYASSPGGCSEIVRFFVGELVAPPRAGVSGMAGEGEDIRSHILRLDEAVAMVEDGRIIGVTGVIGVLWLAAQAPKLRREWEPAAG